MLRQSDRLQVTLRSFVAAYFGHVSVQSAVWSELERMLDVYVCGEKRAGNDTSKLQAALAGVMVDHPLLARFPVSPKQKKTTLKWLERVLSTHGEIITSEELQRMLLDEDFDVETEEPEFVFKTYERPGQDVFLTLLEENRDLIGHGTTGLASWQGGLFLADWCLAHPEVLEVNAYENACLDRLT